MTVYIALKPQTRYFFFINNNYVSGSDCNYTPKKLFEKGRSTRKKSRNVLKPKTKKEQNNVP